MSDSQDCYKDWIKAFTFWKLKTTKKLQIEINNLNILFFIINLKKLEGWFKN